MYLDSSDLTQILDSLNKTMKENQNFIKEENEKQRKWEEELIKAEKEESRRDKEEFLNFMNTLIQPKD